MSSEHSIQELRIQLNLEGRLRHRTAPLELSPEAERGILAVIEQELDRISPGNETIFIDQLDINIGEIQWEEFETTFPQQVQAALREALARHRAIPEAATISGTLPSANPEEARRLAVQHFLQHGHLPWWYAAEGVNPRDLISSAWTSSRHPFQQWLQSRQLDSHLMQRLALQAPPEVTHAILRFLAPGLQGMAYDMFIRIAATLSEVLPSTRPSTLLPRLYVQLVNRLIASGYTVSSSTELISSVIHEVRAAESNVPATKVTAANAKPARMGSAQSQHGRDAVLHYLKHRSLPILAEEWTEAEFSAALNALLAQSPLDFTFFLEKAATLPQGMEAVQQALERYFWEILTRLSPLEVVQRLQRVPASLRARPEVSRLVETVRAIARPLVGLEEAMRNGDIVLAQSLVLELPAELQPLAVLFMRREQGLWEPERVGMLGGALMSGDAVRKGLAVRKLEGGLGAIARSNTGKSRRGFAAGALKEMVGEGKGLEDAVASEGLNPRVLDGRTSSGGFEEPKAKIETSDAPEDQTFSGALEQPKAKMGTSDGAGDQTVSGGFEQPKTKSEKSDEPEDQTSSGGFEPPKTKVGTSDEPESQTFLGGFEQPKVKLAKSDASEDQTSSGGFEQPKAKFETSNGADDQLSGERAAFIWFLRHGSLPSWAASWSEAELLGALVAGLRSEDAGLEARMSRGAVNPEVAAWVERAWQAYIVEALSAGKSHRIGRRLERSLRGLTWPRRVSKWLAAGVEIARIWRQLDLLRKAEIGADAAIEEFLGRLPVRHAAVATMYLRFEEVGIPRAWFEAELERLAVAESEIELTVDLFQSESPAEVQKADEFAAWLEDGRSNEESDLSGKIAEALKRDGTNAEFFPLVVNALEDGRHVEFFRASMRRHWEDWVARRDGVGLNRALERFPRQLKVLDVWKAEIERFQLIAQWLEWWEHVSVVEGFLGLRRRLWVMPPRFLPLASLLLSTAEDETTDVSTAIELVDFEEAEGGFGALQQELLAGQGEDVLRYWLEWGAVPDWWDGVGNEVVARILERAFAKEPDVKWKDAFRRAHGRAPQHGVMIEAAKRAWMEGALIFGKESQDQIVAQWIEALGLDFQAVLVEVQGGEERLAGIENPLVENQDGLRSVAENEDEQEVAGREFVAIREGEGRNSELQGGELLEESIDGKTEAQYLDSRKEVENERVDERRKSGGAGEEEAREGEEQRKVDSQTKNEIREEEQRHELERARENEDLVAKEQQQSEESRLEISLPEVPKAGTKIWLELMRWFGEHEHPPVWAGRVVSADWARTQLTDLLDGRSRDSRRVLVEWMRNNKATDVILSLLRSQWARLIVEGRHAALLLSIADFPPGVRQSKGYRDLFDFFAMVSRRLVEEGSIAVDRTMRSGKHLLVDQVVEGFRSEDRSGSSDAALEQLKAAEAEFRIAGHKEELTNNEQPRKSKLPSRELGILLWFFENGSLPPWSSDRSMSELVELISEEWLSGNAKFVGRLHLALSRDQRMDVLIPALLRAVARLFVQRKSANIASLIGAIQSPVRRKPSLLQIFRFVEDLVGWVMAWEADAADGQLPETLRLVLEEGREDAATATKALAVFEQILLARNVDPKSLNPQEPTPKVVAEQALPSVYFVDVARHFVLSGEFPWWGTARHLQANLTLAREAAATSERQDAVRSREVADALRWPLLAVDAHWEAFVEVLSLAEAQFPTSMGREIERWMRKPGLRNRLMEQAPMVVDVKVARILFRTTFPELPSRVDGLIDLLRARLPISIVPDTMLRKLLEIAAETLVTRRATEPIQLVAVLVKASAELSGVGASQVLELLGNEQEWLQSVLGGQENVPDQLRQFWERNRSLGSVGESLTVSSLSLRSQMREYFGQGFVSAGNFDLEAAGTMIRDAAKLGDLPLLQDWFGNAFGAALLERIMGEEIAALVRRVMGEEYAQEAREEYSESQDDNSIFESEASEELLAQLPDFGMEVSWKTLVLNAPDLMAMVLKTLRAALMDGQVPRWSIFRDWQHLRSAVIAIASVSEPDVLSAAWIKIAGEDLPADLITIALSSVPQSEDWDTESEVSLNTSTDMDVRDEFVENEIVDVGELPAIETPASPIPVLEIPEEYADFTIEAGGEEALIPEESRSTIESFSSEPGDLYGDLVEYTITAEGVLTPSAEGESPSDIENLRDSFEEEIVASSELKAENQLDSLAEGLADTSITDVDDQVESDPETIHPLSRLESHLQEESLLETTANLSESQPEIQLEPAPEVTSKSSETRPEIPLESSEKSKANFADVESEDAAIGFENEEHARKIRRQQAEARAVLEAVLKEGEWLRELSRKELKDWVAEEEKSRQREELNRLKTEAMEGKNLGADGGIPVHNAGLVILYPFFTRFFRQVGLMEKSQWKDEASQARGVYLLEYMVDSKDWEDGAPEHLLVLNRILCGYPLETPLPPMDPLTETEKEQCTLVLKATMQNWKAMSKTSVQGLQHSFIFREGILSRRGPNWNLKVERRTYDAVLSQLDWGFAVIKLPYNPYFIYTEWI